MSWQGGFCCACSGSCAHVGPHSYCAQHGLGAQPMSGANTATFLPLKGWQCPVCGAVMAPFIPYCKNEHSRERT